MTQTQPKTRFESKSGAQLALRDMAVTGVLQNSFAVVELSQTYRNTESTNIEATYTFPLSVEGTLLKLSVQLNDKLLEGCVTERSKAEAKYEEAIAGGDTAVMLEQVEPGLYTMNVGNLLPEETAIVKLRYALPLKWEGDQLRLALPMTIAPRYGDHAEAGVQAHQVPTVDITAEHTYSLALQILGHLGGAKVSSPSHGISTKAVDGGLEISFADGRAYADRDLVLSLIAASDAASAMTVARSGEGHVAHAVFRIPERSATQNIALKVLVDCSGSMAGDSIRLAKDGAAHALQLLKSGDLFSVSAFGSSVVHDRQFRGLLMAGGEETTFQKAYAFVQSLDANLGGTELQAALESVFALKKAKGSRSVEKGEVLLITDGETWNREPIVRACRASGHRVFVIGIGSCPSEAVVREIAESTGGAATFVSPNENIRTVIERHLRRMRVPRVTRTDLSLPGEITWQSPARIDDCVFPGDTLHVFCGLKSLAPGAASLSVRYADESEVEIVASAEVGNTEDFTRLGAAARIREGVLEGKESRKAELTALAVEHQIMSPFTNYIFVHNRGDGAATKMPELRQQPNMLTAGWGGAGSVVAHSHVAPTLAMSSGQFSRRLSAVPMDFGRLQQDDDIINVPTFLRQSAIEEEWESPGELNDDTANVPAIAREPSKNKRQKSPGEIVEQLNKGFSLLSRRKSVVLTIDGSGGLSSIGVDIEVIDALRDLIDGGWDEAQVVLAFWLAILSAPLGAHFSRAHRRAILAASKQKSVRIELSDWMSVCLEKANSQELILDEIKPVPIFKAAFLRRELV